MFECNGTVRLVNQRELGGVDFCSNGGVEGEKSIF